MIAKYKVIGNSDRLDEIVAVMATYGPATTDEERLIRKIAKYLQGEQFSLIHLEAILRIVVSTNSNEATIRPGADISPATEVEIIENGESPNPLVAFSTEELLAEIEARKEAGSE